MPKNLAFGMDSRDLGTIVAEHAATLVEVTGTACADGRRGSGRQGVRWTILKRTCCPARGRGK